MAAASFEILLQTPTAVPVRTLDRVVECVYARAENDAGEMTLVLPDNVYRPTLFAPFSRILIQRALPGRQPYIDLNTPWFLVNGPFYDLGADGRRVVVLECMDALGFILSGSNVAYQQYSDQALKQGYADNLAKAIVRENIGSLATDTARDRSAWMSVEADKTKAAFISAMSFERMQVLDAVQKLAHASAEASPQPVWMGFDISIENQRTGKLIFKTYVGQRGLDHRRGWGGKLLTLSAASGSLSKIRTGFYYREAASYVYAGGASVADLKPIAVASDPELLALGPFGRRERYIDTQAPDDVSLQGEADAGLRRMRPYKFITAESVEVAGAIRGIDWDYGDRATAEAHNGETFSVRINGIGVKLSAGRDGGLIEQDTVSLRGESYALR